MVSSERPAARSVSIVTLGCSRNEVDSEELAGRLRVDGWQIVDDPAQADVALINTCGFIDAAKKDSIDVVLAAADLGEDNAPAVVAVGCLAERYGQELADQLPEAAAVLGFDAYPELPTHLRSLLAGQPVASHQPRDRRQLLPLTPLDRGAAAAAISVPGHGRASSSAPTAQVGLGPLGPPLRERLDHRPWAPLKIASGCDRRCSFCAIPSFRGAYVSRPAEQVVAEARWLVESGVRELLLVSENSTSYGKDLGDLRLLESLLPDLAEIDELARVRVSYLQPAEMRPGLVDTIANTPGVAAYFDLSFQHASGPLLRAMNRFGSATDFLRLLDTIRRHRPDAGVRSNVIVGFPGETEEDLTILEEFLVAARMDVVGVFGYSAEGGTTAEQLPGHLPAREIDDRVSRISALVEEICASTPPSSGLPGKAERVAVRLRGGPNADSRRSQPGRARPVRPSPRDPRPMVLRELGVMTPDYRCPHGCNSDLHLGHGGGQPRAAELHRRGAMTPDGRGERPVSSGRGGTGRNVLTMSRTAPSCRSTSGCCRRAASGRLADGMDYTTDEDDRHVFAVAMLTDWLDGSLRAHGLGWSPTSARSVTPSRTRC